MKLYLLTLLLTILTLDDVNVVAVDKLDERDITLPRRRAGLVSSHHSHDAQ